MTGESLEALRRFFEVAPAARKATRSLSRDARVGLELPEGPARFRMEADGPRVEAGAEPDPDFTLTLPAAAVRHITAREDGDVGEFGVAFFQQVLARNPEERVRIHVQASTARLVAHGYLGVLASGGMKVTWWLLRNGVKNPRAAIDRLRGR
jgi:hypothetical protein